MFTVRIELYLHIRNRRFLGTVRRSADHSQRRRRIDRAIKIHLFVRLVPIEFQRNYESLAPLRPLRKTGQDDCEITEEQRSHHADAVT